MHKQSGQSKNISRRLPHIPTINSINTERNEATNEIETMNNLLREMQKENDKKSEMLNSVFDKNFDGKIKTCINTRAEMEARTAAFETIIQSETLIKKPIKDITSENIYEGVFGTNFSQTGSITDEIIMSPVEQQQIILEYAAETNLIKPKITPKVADVISPHTADITPPNKVINDQISTKHVDTTGKKITKGFSEAALTKVGHWRSAFKFFRTKNASSGKDTALSQNVSEKKSQAENNRSRQPVRDVQIGRIPQENSKRIHWSRKMKPLSHREIKRERSKKTLQRSPKQKESKKVKSAQISVTTELSSTSDAMKRHAAKLTEAKKRLKERNAITSEKKKLNLKTKETRSNKSASHRDLVIEKEGAKNGVQKSKKYYRN